MALLEKVMAYDEVVVYSQMMFRSSGLRRANGEASIELTLSEERHILRCSHHVSTIVGHKRVQSVSFESVVSSSRDEDMRG